MGTACEILLDVIPNLEDVSNEDVSDTLSSW